MRIIVLKIAQALYGDALRVTALIGLVLAVVVSWNMNQSALWVWLHGFLGWIYVFYHLENWIMFSIFLSGYILAIRRAILNLTKMVKMAKFMMGGS